MTLKFKCEKCGYETENPTIEYEVDDLEFDGPHNWGVNVMLGITCPNCKEIYEVKGDCVN